MASAIETAFNNHLKDQKDPVDVLAGVTEEAINAYLASHREWDSDIYTYSRCFRIDGEPSDSCDQDNGIVVTLRAGVDADGKKIPIKIDFLSEADANNRLNTIYPAHGYTYSYIDNGEPDPPKPNARLVIDFVQIDLAWPNSKGGSWGPERFGPFRFEADIALTLEHQNTQLDEGDFTKEYRTSLSIVLVSAKVTLSDASPIPDDEHAKFNDLMLGVTQYLAKTVAPGLTQSIELPVLSVENVPIYPHSLSFDDKVAVIGAGVNMPAYNDHAQEIIDTATQSLSDAIRADTINSGDLVALAYGEEIADKVAEMPDAEAAAFLERQTEQKIDFQAAMPRTAAVVKRWKEWADLREFEEVSDRRGPFPGRRRRRRNRRRGRSVKPVVDGFGFALNEFISELVLNASLPEPKSDRSEVKKYKVAKGYTTTWGRISSASVDYSAEVINDLKDADIVPASKDILDKEHIEVAADIDYGASLHYAFKRFYDCSWRWGSWRSVGIRLVGRPKVSARIITANGGVRFRVTIDLDKLELDIDLNNRMLEWIIERLFDLFIKPFLETLFNAIGFFLSFVLIPLRVDMPQQRTDILFSRVKPFPLSADNATGKHKQFLGLALDAAPVRGLE